jgi:hypothetical protein
MSVPVWNFEQEPSNEPLDETGINLRAYFDNIPDDKLRQYNPIGRTNRRSSGTTISAMTEI